VQKPALAGLSHIVRWLTERAESLALNP